MDNKILLALAGAVIVALSFLIFWDNKEVAEARQWPGYIATFATSTPSQSVTAATVELLFASSSCSSRVIGTRTGEIRLTFRDTGADRPTGQAGFSQAASSTVVYDAETFGCGAVYVYPFVTETLSVMEYQ